MFCYFKVLWNLIGIFIEILFFYVLNVRIIFGNINGCDIVVEGVIIIEDVGKIIVSIDEISFDFLLGYRKLGKVIISILIYSLREVINFLYVVWLLILRVLNWFIFV